MPAGDRPRRSDRSTRKSVEKEDSKRSKKSKTEEVVVNDSLEDLIDSSDDSSSGDNEISKPWIMKTKLDTEINKKSSMESQSGIPKKKKEEETADDSSNVKSEPSSLIASMAPPVGGGTGSSLIANMKPMQAKQQTVREWKSKDEYKAFKAGKTVNKSLQSASSNTVLPQKREVSPVYNTPLSISASPIRELSDIENKMHKALSTLISHVIDSDGKKTSSTPQVTSDPFLNITHSVEETTNKNDTSKGGLIDWDGTFIPQTMEERFDYFGDDEDYSKKKPIPMFPEDFKEGEKEWPLSWWGIMKPSQEVLDMHPNLPKEYRKRSSSRSKKDDRRADRNDQRESRRGNTFYNDKYEHGGQFQGGPSARSDHFAPHSFPTQNFDRYDGNRGPPPIYHQQQHISGFSREGSQSDHLSRGFPPPDRTFGRGFQPDRGFGHGPGRGGSHRHRG
jgi:hypothetical protein